MTQDPQNLIWLDLEMTGLDTLSDNIIEIATVVTDKDLNVLAEGPELAIHQPDSVLERMDDWNRRQHTESGLVERVQKSAISVTEAEARTLAFLMKHVPEGKSPMCGNSICQDRRFLARLMPALERYFHYRNIDVSTLKELAYRWSAKMAAGYSKATAHRALEDAYDSINELKYYREHFISLSATPSE